jgi:hypothetical protein
MMVKALGATLAIAVAALAVWFGGAAGLIYLVLYGAALVPGLPLGWRLFGRAHPAGWIAGALMGYGLTTLALWVPMRLGAPGRPAFAAAWLVLTAAIWLTLRRSTAPAVALPPWTRRDAAAWLLLLHLVPILLALPFGRAGEQDRSGTRYYRAYFTADFVWHTALTQEVARYRMPPTNPYLAPEPLHYYWAYFVVPAVLAGSEDAAIVPTEAALKINATGTALLLLSIVFFAAWSACGRGVPAAIACAVMLVAASFEGLYELIDLWRAGRPLDSVREINIDAVTAWRFQGLRIDGLVRSMWYTPQHSTSLALGMIAVTAATAIGSARTAASWLAGLALGLSVIMNPFLGAAFCAVYGTAAAADAVRQRSARVLARHTASVVPAALGLGWCLLNRMSEGAGGAITFGWLYLARQSPVLTFLLSFGGILALALIGLWPWRGLSWARAVPALSALTVGLVLLYFVSIIDRAWVGFRAGNILFVTMPMLAARGLTGLAMRGAAARTAATVAVVLLIAAGAPTTIIDAFNAQDIENRKMGPGFLWTIPITPAQQAGFRWLRDATPPDAIVQADPVVRGRQNWSVIQTFAGRRAAAGLPISLLAQEEYERRSDRVHAMITALPVEAAYETARSLRIGYVWLDRDDQATAAATAARWATRPDLFAGVFRRGDVTIFAVR